MPTFDIKQLTHIAAELLLIGGITYYFHVRNNFLQNKLIETRQKVMEQDARIKNLEDQVKQLLGMVQMMTCPPPQPATPPFSKAQFINVVSEKNDNSIPIKKSKPEIKQPVIEVIDSSPEENIFRESPKESRQSSIDIREDSPASLDDELQNELAELSS